MLVINLVKDSNQKLDVKLILVMAVVGGVICSIYGINVVKVIKYGVNERFSGSLG